MRLYPVDRDGREPTLQAIEGWRATGVIQIRVSPEIGGLRAGLAQGAEAE